MSMNDNRNNIKFSFNSEGYIDSIKFPFLSLEHFIYMTAATVIHTVETSMLYGFKDVGISAGKVYNLRSSEEFPLYDRVIDRYTNWTTGCSLNSTLTAYGWFLYDLSYQIVRNGKTAGDLYHMREDCSYIGAPIKGVVDKRGIEIITDALDALQKYYEKISENVGVKCKLKWNENNEELLKLFKVEKNEK